MVVTITGHRPSKLPGGYNHYAPDRALIREWLRDTFISLGVSYLYSGMALGIDLDAADLAVQLAIPFTAAIPCDHQHRWSTDLAQYDKLCAAAAEQIVVSPGPYEPWKMHARNRWMVDRSAQVIAVWDGSTGGTANCVRYARSHKKRVTVIHPVKGLQESEWLFS